MGHAAVHVENVESALKFYKEVLGFEPHWEGDKDWANVKIGSDDLSLVKKSGAVHPPHLGLRVASLEKLKTLHFNLKSKVTDVEDICLHRDGTSSFYFKDPDHNQLEALFDPRENDTENK